MAKRSSTKSKPRLSKKEMLRRMAKAGVKKAAPETDTIKPVKRTLDPAVKDLITVARNLFRKGQFEHAYDAFLKIAARDPSSKTAQLAISAILAGTGHKEDAQVRMAAHFQSYPMDRPVLPENRPLLLKLRGFDQTRPTIGKSRDGTYKAKLRGGHYTTQYFLMKPDFAVNTFTIANDNINQPGVLPEADILLNTIAEPDIEGDSLKTLSRFAQANPNVVLINHPDRVWHTARDRNYDRLAETDRVIFPETRRIHFERAMPSEVLPRVAELGVSLPFIIREAGTQTGRTTQLCETVYDLETYAKNGLTGDYFVIAYRQILWQQKFFRKLRLFHIDGAFYPVVCHLDQIWNVHGGNRKEIMRNDERLMAEERAFLTDWKSYVGPGNADNMYWLAEETGMEFFGIDFTIDDDNRIFIYELNAAMRHSFDHAANFRYKIEHDLETTNAFMRMVRSRLPADWPGHARPAPEAVAPVNPTRIP